jgi:selenide,water dikinase
MNAPDRAALRLTQFSHGGGCGCKIAPAVLQQIVAKTVPGIVPKELLVGIETADDAAVYQINETQLADRLVGVARALLTDPQTSGGLLVACAPDAVNEVLAVFRNEGFARAAAIGQIVPGIPQVTVI